MSDLWLILLPPVAAILFIVGGWAIDRWDRLDDGPKTPWPREKE